MTNTFHGIFATERERLHNKLTVLYSEAGRTIQYRDETRNTLTVKFETNEDERFFFRPFDMIVTKEMKQANREATFGIYFMLLQNKGRLSEKTPVIMWEGKEVSLKQFLKIIPTPLRNVPEDYRWNRSCIGVDEKPRAEEAAKTEMIRKAKALKASREAKAKAEKEL